MLRLGGGQRITNKYWNYVPYLTCNYTQLYRQQKDLRTVQKQLGHSKIQTTQVYADVTKEDVQKQIKGMWN